MANMLQSSQNKETTAPSYYTDYLSNLATAGKTAACGAEYVGAQPLQTKAFEKACQNFGAQMPAIATGQRYVGQAAGQNVTGAAAPFLQAGTGSSPLSAMEPYAKTAMCTTGYEAGQPLVGQGAAMSGLSSANPYLGSAAGTCGACVSGQYVNQATKLNMTGAAQPYLQQAATSGGLSAAQPYLQQATSTSPADMAASYMNPYLKTAVQSMSDIAQRNIRQNLSPAAAAAAVGSGQFGSQRGAQVQGQITAQAQQDLNNQIAQMMSQGYGQALCAAGKQNALVANAGNTAGTLAQQQANLLAQVGQTSGSLTGQQMQNLINAGNIQGTLTQQKANTLAQLGQTAGSLTNQEAQNKINAGTNLGNLQQGANQIAAGLGSTAANAQAQQNQAQLTAGQTAAQAAANQGQLLNTAGQNMGNLAQTGAGMNLACINALSTLGGQQQTIGQNEENFPLTKLASLGSLLQGYSIPVGTKTTLCMSPLSGLAAVGSGALGMVTPRYDASGKMIEGSSPVSSIYNAASSFGDWLGKKLNSSGEYSPNIDGTGDNPYGGATFECCCCAWGCASGGLVKAKPSGYMGCASTTHRGALPSKKG